MKHALFLIAAFAVIVSAGPVWAATGPVGTACKDDIAKFCAGKPHRGDTRACLEANKDKVSAACKSALESTPRGQNKNKKHKGQDKGAPDE